MIVKTLPVLNYQYVMKQNKEEKWIEAVMTSMEGSQRAAPTADLFSKIESLIDGVEEKNVPVRQWRMIAIAASLVLVLNVFALRQFSGSYVSAAGDYLQEGESNQQLISDFKIYE